MMPQALEPSAGGGATSFPFNDYEAVYQRGYAKGAERLAALRAIEWLHGAETATAIDADRLYQRVKQAGQQSTVQYQHKGLLCLMQADLLAQYGDYPAAYSKYLCAQAYHLILDAPLLAVALLEATDLERRAVHGRAYAGNARWINCFEVIGQNTSMPALLRLRALKLLTAIPEVASAFKAVQAYRQMLQIIEEQTQAAAAAPPAPPRTVAIGRLRKVAARTHLKLAECLLRLDDKGHNGGEIAAHLKAALAIAEASAQVRQRAKALLGASPPSR